MNRIPDNSRLSPTENFKPERVQSNRPIHSGTPDTTQTGSSCLVWRYELSRPSVGVCRAAQALPVRPPDALRRRTHLSGSRADSIHDRDRTVLSCLTGGVNWALASAAANRLLTTVRELQPINFVTLTRVTNNASCNWVNSLQFSSVQFSSAAVKQTLVLIGRAITMTT